MKKEILLAVLVGLALGLIIVYGIYRARKIDQDLADQAATSATETLPHGSPQGNLIIHSPEDEIIVSEDKISVAGITSPEAFVVIFVNDQDFITSSDQSGNFSMELELEDGSNVISVHSLDENGVSIKEERTVIYTQESLLEETDASPSGEKDD